MNTTPMSETTPDLSEKAKAFKPGIYKHFKCGMYRAFFVARNSEALDQEFVVYQSLENGFVWVRPLDMFLDNVERDGYSGPRFLFVDAK